MVKENAGPNFNQDFNDFSLSERNFLGKFYLK